MPSRTKTRIAIAVLVLCILVALVAGVVLIIGSEQITAIHDGGETTRGEL
jgi:hypothetical protein